MGRKGGHRQHEIEQLEKLRVVGVGCVYCCLEPSTTPHKLSFLTPSTRAPFVSHQVVSDRKTHASVSGVFAFQKAM